MFMHIYKYRIKELMRGRMVLFWTLAFPVILGTFYYVTLGSFMDKGEVLKSIPVAVVENSENQNFDNFLYGLSQKGSDQILKVTYADKEEAEALLRDKKVDGIFVIAEKIQLTVKSMGINQSILSSISDSYFQMERMIEKTVDVNPQNLEKILNEIKSDATMNQEIELSDGNQDSMLQYFYALLAMVSLYASFLGLTSAGGLQANLTNIAARKMISPFPRMKMILGDFAANITIHFSIMLVVIGYLGFILGVDFGDKLGFILLTILTGSVVGVTMGFFVGCIGRVSVDTKMGLMVGISMFLSFFSGLFFNSIKNMVEQICPILNRINPAVLIADAFYSLNIYNTYGRYWRNIGTLIGFAAIFVVGGFLLARRKKYASL